MSETETFSGSCHCGAIRYEISGAPMNHTLCHCADCRRATGAPMVGWAMVAMDQLAVSGEPAIYASGEDARRHFCIQCGTSLFYSNAALLPGVADVTTATLDDPEALPPDCHIQVAERIGWMATQHDLAAFERFPPHD
ncbi:GFA family protein [Paraurantiacibacter namhicola]|uniref:Glutathione-dependent formaldehyde-activating enzyme n=1 Tax=Paraurantiacibacter namhicola TaxID=645517 RepID=A0A1C7D8F6_9SPHN|nr:GFA family protein [Paraurantiacibacter namhicola]ANU07725.1 Glutathione-dependent formaldehyde-activating enzyme [Paraurantiacibacter namhicola]